MRSQKNFFLGGEWLNIYISFYKYQVKIYFWAKLSPPPQKSNGSTLTNCCTMLHNSLCSVFDLKGHANPNMLLGRGSRPTSGKCRIVLLHLDMHFVHTSIMSVLTSHPSPTLTLIVIPIYYHKMVPYRFFCGIQTTSTVKLMVPI